jgi:hypothetical protein
LELIIKEEKMKRKFYLENEKGQRYDLNNLKESCLFNSPSGLGYSYKSDYKQLGTTFINNTKELNQGEIQGNMIFKSYDKYLEFIYYIENSIDLKWVYSVPFLDGTITEYFKDIDINTIEKTEKETGILNCPISFYCKTLWYAKTETIYTITPSTNELRWNFKWDSKFTSYDNRNITFENKGHTEAPFLLEIDGYVLNPTIAIYVEGIKQEELALNLVINEGEKLLYSTKDNDLYIQKVLANGTKENAFNNLNLNNNNFFKLPKGLCEIRLIAGNDITSATLTIYVQFISV